MGIFFFLECWDDGGNFVAKIINCGNFYRTLDL